MRRKIRVLVAKPGLDGHDRGAKVVAAALRDAGMEVIYTGLHQTPAQVVEAAVQEDVDVVALSILSGAHMTLFPEVLELMRERGIGDRLLTGGGIIPPEDMETLDRMGVGRLFGPGSSTQDIAVYVRQWCVGRYGEEGVAPLAVAGAARPASQSTTSSAAGSRSSTSSSAIDRRERGASAPRTGGASAKSRAAKDSRASSPRAATPSASRSSRTAQRARSKKTASKRAAKPKPARKRTPSRTATRGRRAAKRR
jgi:methylmalonyl-CoA mutase C-terminal domain/subunit